MTVDEPVSRLLAWFRAGARDLPWRRQRDPYRVWISEVMLQQTQVATVERYFEPFIARFPNVTALAQADLSDVLACWQGLGYYGRARSLWRAARQVVADHGGALPSDPAVLRSLPGIGEYTAAAIVSLCHGQPVAALDGNIARVITRLRAIPDDPRRNPARRRVRAALEALLPHDTPGEFNEALMELGATVCRSRRPRCGGCPLAGDCAALAAGEPERYPERDPRRAARSRLHVAAVVRRDGRVLVGRRPAAGRWGGLWELPRVELAAEAEPTAALAAGLAALLGVEARVGAELARLAHAVSGERIDLRAYACETEAEPRPLGYEALAWVAAEAPELPMASPQRQLLAKLRTRFVLYSTGDGGQEGRS